MGIKRFVSALMLVMGLAVGASAQTNSLALPLYQPSGLTEAGKWTFDWPDGAGGDISFGGSAMGISADGQFIYIGCNVGVSQRGIAKLRIPAIGQQAQVVQPCQGPTYQDLVKLLPTADGGTPLIGGVVEADGQVCVTGYWTYDASNRTVASHWCGPTLTSLRGPFKSTVATGLVKDHMFRIPPEWQQLLGGSVGSTAGYTSIISRGSYGAALSTFKPADVVANNFPMNLLLACPDSVASCRTYGSPTSNDYNGSELSGGAFIVPGTRTLFVVERESSGPTCYGYGTRNPAEHGQPYLDAVKCYSLIDPVDQKGPKGFPYRLVGKLYDLQRLVDAKNGVINPWDIKQYATIDLPGSSADQMLRSGTFNPVTGEYHYMVYERGGVNEIKVIKGFPKAGSTAPVPTDCVPGVESMVIEITDDQCVGGVKTFTQDWIRTGDIPATNGGLACTPVVTPRTRTETCVVPPPPPTTVNIQCVVTAQGTRYSDGDQRPTIRCDNNFDGPRIPNGTTFILTVPKN